MLVIAAALLAAAIVRGQGAQTSPASPAALSPQAAAVSGRVIDAATGAPLADAVVTLMRGIASRQAIERQLTDRSGRFVFAGLPASVPYQVSAAKPGYFDSAGEPGDLRATYVSLTPGEWRRDVDVRLSRHAAISGTVRDERGDLVVGAYVGILAAIFAGGVPHFATGPPARTDDRGEYHVGPLTAGTYVVVVPSIHVTVPADTRGLGITSAHDLLPLDGPGFVLLAPGSPGGPFAAADGRRHAYPTTFHPEARTLADATAVELAAGEDAEGIDVRLRPVPVHRVSGQLEGPPDAVANRRIRLVPAGGENLGIGHEAAVTLTRPDGSFTFADVPDGRYIILAADSATGFDFHPPGAPAAASFDIVASLAAPFGVRSTVGGAAAATAIFRGRATEAAAGIRVSTYALNRHVVFAGRTAVEVAGGDQSGIVVRLSEGVSIGGRFVFDTAEDRIALSAITPYLEVAAQPAGAEPSLQEARGGAVPNAPILDFVVKNVLPGDYVFRVLGEAAITKAVTLNGRDYTGLPFTVGDRHLSGLLVTVTSRGARIEGVVRDANGQPAAQAAVMHFPTDPARWRRYGAQPERLRTVLADTQGHFDFVRMPAGDYFLLAVDNTLADRWKDPTFLEAAARLATRISVEWGETRTQPLTLTAVTWR